MNACFWLKKEKRQLSFHPTSFVGRRFTGAILFFKSSTSSLTIIITHLPSKVKLPCFLSAYSLQAVCAVCVFSSTLEVTQLPPHSSSLCVITVPGCANAPKPRLKSSCSWRTSSERRSSSWQTSAWRRSALLTTWTRSERPWTACRWDWNQPI